MENRTRELEEAVEAADRALEHLLLAKEALNSAGHWGVFDLLGGGFFSTFIKRGKMSDAEQELTLARQALRRFAAELRDVNDIVEIHLVNDDFLGFADYFFDGMIADWMVQSKINAAKAQVSQAIERVTAAKETLQGLL